MRDNDFLPYEKAIEAMAREYSKIRPKLPLDEEVPASEETQKNQKSVESFITLENAYCNALELIMLLRQLLARVVKPDLAEQLNSLIAIESDIALKLGKVYNAACSRDPVSPAVNKMVIPALLRRIMRLQAEIIASEKALTADYPELMEIAPESIRASLLLDSIIIIITAL